MNNEHVTVFELFRYEDVCMKFSHEPQYLDKETGNIQLQSHDANPPACEK